MTRTIRLGTFVIERLARIKLSATFQILKKVEDVLKSVYAFL